MENFQDIQVIIDPEAAGMDFDVRRPYFRMRGKPVTEEQAFDIIRQTDEFFCHDMRSYGKPFVSYKYEWTPGMGWCVAPRCIQTGWSLVSIDEIMTGQAERGLINRIRGR